MSPVLAVKRCSRVTAARAAYFLHDQDPKLNEVLLVWCLLGGLTR